MQVFFHLHTYVVLMVFMVFADDSKKPMEGVMAAYGEILRCSGLKINLDKSMLFMVDIW